MSSAKINVLDLTLSVAIAYLNNRQAVSDLIEAAHARSEPGVSTADLKALLDSVDADIAKLDADIAVAKAEGR